MKKLRKVLVAFAILALLVSSVAVIAVTAADSTATPSDKNLQELEALVIDLEKIKVDTSNLGKINNELEDIDEFLSKKKFNKADPFYVSYISRINLVRETVTKLENVAEFANLLTQFQRATTVASMTRRSVALDAIYKLQKYNIPANAELVCKDTAILNFEALINGSLESTDDAYVDVFEYYAMIPDLIAEQVKVENSVKIMKCVGLILDIEGYEDSEEFWIANYEEIEFLVSIIRDIVIADNYDPTYPGVDDAMAQYEALEVYFYEVLQQKHIEVIGDQLDMFEQITSYIEKMGICTYLDRYFESNNDIDFSRPEMQDFVYRLGVYKAELEVYAADYENLLETNTNYFIDVINRMSAFTTYADLKPLYDEALSYYCVMNVNSAEAKAAVEAFDRYDKALKVIEENSELFLKASVMLVLIGTPDINAENEYMILSDCAAYYDYVDATYSRNMEQKLELYESLVGSYNAQVASANEVVEYSSVISAALRSDEIPAAVLAVINQLSNN